MSRSLVLCAGIICAALLLPAQKATAGTAASLYPSASYGPLAYKPKSIKFGSGTGFHVRSWKRWGRSKAVGRGYLCDHCASPSIAIRAKGKLILGSPKFCGVDRVYTTYRLSFKGRQKRRAKYWRNTRVRARWSVLGCRSGDTNAQVHIPSNWDVVSGEYTASIEDFSPQPQPASFAPTRRMTVELTGPWSNWGAPVTTAIGTAKYWDTWPECSEDNPECERAAPVSITATDLGHCGTYLTYRQVSVKQLLPNPSLYDWEDSLHGWGGMTCND